MTSPFTANCTQRGEWWVGSIEEIPGVNAQERTKPELLASLKEILTEALAFNREDARAAAGQNYTEEPLAV